MSHPTHIQAYFDSQLVPLFLIVDEVLNDWKGDKCYQLPVLLMNIKSKMNWSGEEGDKQFRAKDPIIRDYIRNHPDWYITRGAHGGVMKRADRDKKEAAAESKRIAVEKAKLEVKMAIEADIAKKAVDAAAVLIAITATTVLEDDIEVEDNTEIVSE